MEKETIKLTQLQTNSRNPRKISEKNLTKLVTSLLVLPKMMELRPIVVDDSLKPLGGNQRYKALTAISQMDIAEIQSSLQASHDFQKKTEAERDALLDYWGAWLNEPTAQIIRASELSEAERREFVIKDNTSFGDWDTEMLQADFSKLELEDWGLDDIEFPKEEEDAAKEDDYTDEDAANAPTRCTSGDIWRLGDHLLMCGDSTQKGDVFALVGAEGVVDLFLTDPPYNVAYQGGTADKLTIKNDSMEDAAFRGFLTDAFLAADVVMKKGAAFYIWHADSEGLNFRMAVRNAEWDLKQTLIWNKNSLVLGRQDYQWKHEPCLYGWKSGAGHAWFSDRKQTTVIDFDRPKVNAEHPTMKPVGLFGYLIENSSKEGDLVLDLFGGSGTSIIACEQLGRKCRMMELDPRYCDVILDRWEKLTERTAELVKNVNNHAENANSTL
jgi:site-specific DNA-methyltransferase (adenine-specific)